MSSSDPGLNRSPISFICFPSGDSSSDSSVSSYFDDLPALLAAMWLIRRLFTPVTLSFPSSELSSVVFGSRI